MSSSRVDAALALFAIEQHEVLRQLRAIVGDAPHLQRAAGAAAAGEHAMPVGHRAGAHFLHHRRLREHAAAHDERHDAAAVQEQDPADRPPEQQLAAADRPATRPSRICFGNASSRSVAASTSGSTSTVALPRSRRVKERYVPFGVSTRSSSETSTPFLRAKPMAAGVGLPSGPKAADTGGPLIGSSRSLWRSEMRAIAAVRRRGVANVSIGAPGVSRNAASFAASRSASCLVSGASQLAGSSSHPISRRAHDPWVATAGRSSSGRVPGRSVHALAMPTASCRTRRM